jgi:hypothetical protein
MVDDVQEVLAGSRLRFAASFAALLVLFVVWFYISANWNPDLKLAGFFVHDLLLVFLYGLRFRQLRMSEAWALLAFLPILGLLVAVFLIVRNSPAPERYSAF